jgi:hypothetical protein
MNYTGNFSSLGPGEIGWDIKEYIHIPFHTGRISAGTTKEEMSGQYRNKFQEEKHCAPEMYVLSVGE